MNGQTKITMFLDPDLLEWLDQNEMKKLAVSLSENLD